MKSIHSGLILAPLLLLTSLAHAAEAGDGRWKYELMTGAGVTPRYSGSKDQQAVPMLSFEATSPNGWFLGMGGLGWSTAVGERGTLRTYLAASGVRRDKDSTFGGSDHLRGMGNINARALVGMRSSTVIGSAVLSSNWKYVPKDNKRGDNGLATQQAELSLLFPLAPFAGGQLLGSVNAEYGDRGYMQTWYGVSAAQAANTGFRQHRPKAGLATAGVGINWLRAAGEQGQWLLTVDGKRLLGDAGDSPVVQQRNQLTVSAGYLYSF